MNVPRLVLLSMFFALVLPFANGYAHGDPKALPVQTYTPEQQKADTDKFMAVLKKAIQTDVADGYIEAEQAAQFEKDLNEFQKQAQGEKWVGTDFKEVNILLLGKTRAGKTTLAKVVQNLFHLAGTPSIFVGTINPGIVRVEIRHDGVNYRINFIDTPGLFELAPSEDYNKGVAKRENDTLVELIKSKLIASGLTIHAAFFCFDGNLAPQDLDALKLYLHIIGKLPWIAVHTRAEALLPEDIAAVKEQIAQHPSDLIDHKTLHFAGAEQEPDDDNPYDPMQAMRYLHTIAGYRNALIKYITNASANKPVNPSGFAWPNAK